MRIPTRLTLAGVCTGALVVLAVACGDNGSSGMTPPDLATAPEDMATTTPNPDLTLVVAPPTVTSLDVLKALQKGGGTVKLTGKDFTAGATVKIGTVTATVTNVATDGTSITITVPANKDGAGAYLNPGVYDVTVTNADGQTGKLARAFTYYIETPTFAAAAVVPGTDKGPRFVVKGDFDGDGDMDLATVNADADVSGTSDSLTVFVNDGKGVFTLKGARYIVGNYPYSVTAADVNNDTFLDLIVPNKNSNDVHVLLGNGDGTFKTPKQNMITGANQPQSVAVSDANNDGKMDLVVTSLATTNNVHVLPGANSDTFGTAQTATYGTSPYTAVAGKFDGDERIDVALGHFQLLGVNPVSILLNDNKQAAPYFRMQATNGGGGNVYGLAVGYFNDDKYLDLLASNNFSNGVGVILGSANGTFTPPANPTAAGGNTNVNPEGVATGDLNGDGFVDAFAAMYNTVANGAGDISYFLGKGDGTLMPVAKVGVGNDDPNSLVVGDWNGDGRLDIAYTSYRNTAGTLVIRLGNGN